MERGSVELRCCGTAVIVDLTGDDDEWLGCFVSGGFTPSAIVRGEPTRPDGDDPAEAW